MSQLKAVILAAGKGTRMKSDLPKVVHTIEGKCLVDYAIEAAEGAGADEICLVVGYKYEIVRESSASKPRMRRSPSLARSALGGRKPTLRKSACSFMMRAKNRCCSSEFII